MASNTCNSGRTPEKLIGSSFDIKEPQRGLGFWLREYFGIDLRALALTRIFFALIIIAQLLVLSPDLEVFFSEEGVLGIDTLYSSSVPISVFLLSKTLLWVKILFVIHFIFTFSLLLGFKTRLSSFVVWFLYLSLITRNLMIINSGDILLLLMIFWGIFVPWGARFSIDNLSKDKRLLPKKVLSVGTMAFILQMPLVYFFTGLIKSSDPSWVKDFSAIFYSLAPEFITYGGQLLLSLNVKILEFLTAAVLALEIYGPVFIFFPFFPLFFKWFKINFLSAVRNVLFFVFMLMQLSFHLTLSLGSFPFVSIVSLIPVLHTSFFDRTSKLIRKRRGKELIKVFYDGDCSFCQKALNILNNLGLFSKAMVGKAQDNPRIFDLMREKNSWVVIDRNGKETFRFEALVSVLRENTITKPIYFICKSYWVKNFGNKLYEKVSGNRARAHAILRFFVRENYPLKMSLLLSITCAFFFTFAIYSNFSSIKVIRAPDNLDQTGKSLRINQHWAMFSRPITKVGYFEIDGVLADGRLINLLQGGGPIRNDFEFNYKSSDTPAEILTAKQIYKNRRWRKYFKNLKDQRDPVFIESYVNYLCKAWQKNFPEEPRLDIVTINFIGNERDPAFDNGYKKDWKKTELYFQKC